VVHKDDVCVRVAFEGHRGEEDLHFVPEDQEDLVRALSVYLPEGISISPFSIHTHVAT
jgi:hypothetical protein